MPLLDFIMKDLRWTRKAIFLFMVVFSIQTFAQQKTKLYIFPIDSVGKIALKNVKLIFDVKDSIDSRKKLKQFSNSWIEKGYLTFSIDSIIFDSLKISAFVFVGFQYLNDSLIIENIPSAIMNRTGFGLKSSNKNYFSLNEYIKFRKEIIEYYENNGYPFVSIRFDSTIIKNQYIKGKLLVEKNDLIKIDSIVVKGNPKISRKYLNHYIQIKPGNLFNQLKINEIGKLIGELSYLEQAKPCELEFRKGKADVYLYLRNKPANFFNGMIGFASGTEENPDFQITGDINLLLVNSFKIGEKISFYWDKYNSQSQNLKIGFQFPYLFFIPLGIDFRFGLEKFNIDYLNTSLYAAADYSFSANHKMTAYLSQKKSYLIDNSENPDTTFSGYSIFTAGLSFYLSKTDYSYNPRKGFLIEISSGYGNRSTLSSNSGSIAEIGFRGELYLQYARMGTIAFINRSAGIFSKSDFYNNEMFKIGGINTLRGFDEQSILASMYSIFSIEPRLIIGKNSSVYLFGDVAWYQAKHIENQTIDMPIGFGLGMNIDTKAGIFKINYALGKQFDNPFKLSTSKIHFGFYARF